ncbi:MAG: 4-hydroxy-tetrahydrodipicolinate synthase [Bacteroidetes bacterium]|nr:4-hydroxy-tetrahydrodipicolinate synthase [Bacteroidota bacterium]MBS1540904.1 4-hydroxy-tetrahydrodipicolinate synthase [Bacteroidota bacterium]
MKKFTGTGVALVTPFHADGKIDFTALRKLLTHTAKGVDYFVVMGTTGEAATLKKEEKKEVLQFVLKHNRKNLPIVYGIGGNHTAAVVEEIKTTDLSGVQALLSVSPYYNKPSQEGICQHFKKVADASPVPVILYNVPGRTSSNLTAATTLRLAKHKNIIGIKEASGNLEQCMKIAKEKPEDFLLISGDDLLTVPIYSIGGCGVISVLANAYPVIFKKMTAYASSGHYAKAAAEAYQLLEINGSMYEEGNPTGVKYLLSLLGVCQPHVRLPMAAPSEELKKKIEKLRVR